MSSMNEYGSREISDSNLAIKIGLALAICVFLQGFALWLLDSSSGELTAPDLDTALGLAVVMGVYAAIFVRTGMAIKNILYINFMVFLEMCSDPLD